MTKRMSKQKTFAAERWYMVGAYLAGSTEKEISDLVGLSAASVHNVITQFKKTGSPIHKRLSSAEKQIKHQFDDNGRIYDSDDEIVEPPSHSMLFKRKQKRQPSAKDLINYVLIKSSPKDTSNVVDEEEEDRQTVLIYQNKWRPPSPPYQQPKPSKEALADQTGMPSPPLSEPRDASSDWTVEEDKILMAHLLTRLSSERWNEAVAKLKGRHDSASCKKRWEKLRCNLLKGAHKSGTHGW
ncbi:hypothetical protein BY458DRAFT_473973 [Sporodiniella umbellata]|nr:hypothetical protein BY458DRAFT_473973 [Sporodiniella umbellata]